MNRLLTALLGLLALGIFSFLCIRAHVPVIEKDLASRAGQTLDSQGMHWANASAEGRVLQLAGVAPSAALRDQAEDAVQGLWGVQAVHNQLQVAPAAAQELAQADQGSASVTPAASASLEATPPTGSIPTVRADAGSSLEAPAAGEVTAPDISPPAVPPAGSASLPDVSTPDVTAVTTAATELATSAASAVTPPAVPPAGSASLPDVSTPDVTDMAKKAASTIPIPPGVPAVPAVASPSAPDVSALEGTDVAAVSPDTAAIASATPAANTPSAPATPTGSVKTAAIESPSTGSCQQELNNLLSQKSILFRISSATIRRESFTLLNQLANICTRCANARVEIAGHTDSDGDETSNQKLGLARAQSVVRYLTRKGIGADRLFPVGYGESQPIADNATWDGRQKNRRIEFTLQAKTAG